MHLQTCELETLRFDVFIVVLSLNTPESYVYALRKVEYLRLCLGIDSSIVLVGNKVDLVRQRKVTTKGLCKIFCYHFNFFRIRFENNLSKY